MELIRKLGPKPRQKFALLANEPLISVLENLKGDENFNEVFVDEMEQDNFEDEEMGSDSSLSDTSIDSTISDSDETSE